MLFVNSGMAATVGEGFGGPSYDQFLTHITTLATSGVRTWENATLMSAGGYRTTAGAAVGNMVGTSWNSTMASGDFTCRIIQHGLPSEAEFNAQIAGARAIFFRITVTADKVSFVGLNRNGYASISFDDGTPYATRGCSEIIYWDGTQAQRMQPSLGLGPTPYTW